MRYSLLALLLAVSAACQAAEIETITLADGRVLVGELTPKGLHGGVVALVEPKGAAVSISMDDVKGREKWQAPQLVVYAPGTEPAAKPRAKAKTAARTPPLRARLEEITAARAPLAKAAEEASAAVQRLDRERDELMANADRDFVATGDLATVALSLPANATADDQKRMARAQDLNTRLYDMQRMREHWRQTGEQSHYTIYSRDEFWALYVELKGGSAPY